LKHNNVKEAYRTHILQVNGRKLNLEGYEGRKI